MAVPGTPDQGQRVIRGSSCFLIDKKDVSLSVKLPARCSLRTWAVGFRTFRPFRQVRPNDQLQTSPSARRAFTQGHSYKSSGFRTVLNHRQTKESASS
jgi:hypothetical protein